MSDTQTISALEELALKNIWSRLEKELNESRVDQIHNVFRKYGIYNIQNLLPTITFREYSEYSNTPNINIPKEFSQDKRVTEPLLKFFIKEIAEIKEKTEYLQNFVQ